jgi:lipoprotein-anchoring transpeptidase ErfK/SrfK
VAGARGNDVKTLQKQLRDRGFKRTKVTGVYDDRTARGVRNYQRVHGIKQSGVFGRNTRTAFVGRIVVNLSKFRVSVMRDGKAVVSFPIAYGTAAHPTPTGDYKIVNKQSNPTWTPPPNSSWAKGLGPIPPGPGNPLGTRWMGTSAPFVGIHGTPADSSIGTRASHGCIRMHIHDAEKLYEQVVVGMPVHITY